MRLVTQRAAGPDIDIATLVVDYILIIWPDHFIFWLISNLLQLTIRGLTDPLCFPPVQLHYARLNFQHFRRAIASQSAAQWSFLFSIFDYGVAGRCVVRPLLKLRGKEITTIRYVFDMGYSRLLWRAIVWSTSPWVWSLLTLSWIIIGLLRCIFSDHVVHKNRKINV